MIRDEVATGGKLSEAYHQMSQLGIIQKVRLLNDSMIRDHFERKVGMVRDSDKKVSSRRPFRMACLLLVLLFLV